MTTNGWYRIARRSDLYTAGRVGGDGERRRGEVRGVVRGGEKGEEGD
jgi:hypothetical protein